MIKFVFQKRNGNLGHCAMLFQCDDKIAMVLPFPTIVHKDFKWKVITIIGRIAMFKAGVHIHSALLLSRRRTFLPQPFLNIWFEQTILVKSVKCEEIAVTALLALFLTFVRGINILHLMWALIFIICIVFEATS